MQPFDTQKDLKAASDLIHKKDLPFFLVSIDSNPKTKKTIDIHTPSLRLRDLILSFTNIESTKTLPTSTGTAIVTVSIFPTLSSRHIPRDVVANASRVMHRYEKVGW